MDTTFIEIDKQFNLTKSKVSENDLRAYLYQCIYDPENNQICVQEVENLGILTNEQIKNWNDGFDFKLLNFEQLERLFDSLGYEYPEFIYYFNPIYGFDRNDYRSYPQIFDSIESVSFDKEGLIVLHSGIYCGFQLFSSSETELLRSNYSPIKIGMDGLVQLDDYTDDEEKTEFDIAVNWKYLDNSYEVNIYGEDEKNFPDINRRDLLPIMDNWVKPIYSKDYLNQLYDESIAEKILKEDGCLIRHMPVSFKENGGLAFTACVETKLAFTLLPKSLQKDLNFITKLLDSKEVDDDIRNYIYFDRKAVEKVALEKEIFTGEDKSIVENTTIEEIKENGKNEEREIEENNSIKGALIPIWSPLIIDKFDSITPNLTKKEPDYFEILTYLFQLINSDFIFAESLKNQFNEILNTRPVKEILLDSDLQRDIENSLRQEAMLPFYIYTFNQRRPKEKTDFKSYQTIYTNIVDITFDKGGLLIMESFCRQIHSLHDIAGEVLLFECSDVILGMDGLVAYRYCDVMTEMWCFDVFENGRLNYYNPEMDNFIKYDWNLTNYPFIYRRDLIAYMKDFKEFYCQPNMISQLRDETIIKDILQKDGCLIRYMPDWVKENEEFALLACQMEIAFTLISKKLQHDKTFVLKLYSMPNIDVNIYNFLNVELRSDNDILDLKSEKIRIEEEHFVENQKNLTLKYGDDELPF